MAVWRFACPSWGLPTDERHTLLFQCEGLGKYSLKRPGHSLRPHTRAAGCLTGWRLRCSERIVILTLSAQLAQLQLRPLRVESPRYLLTASQIICGKRRTLDWP